MTERMTHEDYQQALILAAHNAINGLNNGASAANMAMRIENLRYWCERWLATRPEAEVKEISV